ncbi:MAG TPA: methyltransferase domain-containing protein [Acidimicrobiales bacterium]
MAREWTTGRGVFDTVAHTYEVRRPEFPAEVFDEIAAITGLGRGSTVVEIGPGTGQATTKLAQLGTNVVAVEPGTALVELLRRRVAAVSNVTLVTTRFEDWNARARSLDAVVAASSWHWLEPAARWQKAHDILKPLGWLVLIGHIVVQKPGEPEVYAETADLHEAHASGHPSWGHPPTAREVIAAAEAASASIADVERVIGRAPDASETGDLFEPPLLRWFPQVQHFDAHGYVELLRTTSLYGSLNDDVREPLLSAIEQRIRDRMGDRATRRYLISTRLAQRRA